MQQTEPVFPLEPITQWYEEHKRDLPWRRPGVSPWEVLVSEFMLQQTPVARVLPVWIQWTQQWTSAKHLASEPLSEALKAWGRLGYPRRAMRLHQAATTIAQEHNNEVPHDVATLLSLPGVGDYTARAVSNFAYGHCEPVVDVNIRRVLYRINEGVDPVGPRKADLELMSTVMGTKAQAPAALMEFGALMCSAKPRCCDCPVTDQCHWNAAGKPAPSGKLVAQKYYGTDRYVRGLVLAQLRDNDQPVERQHMYSLWSDSAQIAKAIDSLIADGLISAHNDDLILGS